MFIVHCTDNEKKIFCWKNNEREGIFGQTVCQIKEEEKI